MGVPEVRYAENSGINIAYQVFGSGPRDIILVCGTMSNLDLFWVNPDCVTMLERLGRLGRMIVFDKPGTGLSDPIPAAPTLDQRVDDIKAVMDAAGSERAVVIGYSEGSFPAVTMAATDPERVEALVVLEGLCGTHWVEGDDVEPTDFDWMWQAMDRACEHWGDGEFIRGLGPSWVGDPVVDPILGVVEMRCMSKAMARSVLQGYHGIDIRSAAAAVRVPTLVCQSDNRFINLALGRDLARRIAGARFVELVGDDHVVWIQNFETFPAAVEEFLTGSVTDRDDDDRVLATVVFTDIVDSTRNLAALGDSRWRSALGAHDQLVRELLGRFGGVPVKHTGDGWFASFMRPARAVRFATALTKATLPHGLTVRAGVHTGECERVGDDLIGLTVNIGARVAGLAGAGEVLVSSTVRDLVLGSGLAFSTAGRHELKGAPGEWDLYRCVDDAPGPMVAAGYETDVRNPAH